MRIKVEFHPSPGYNAESEDKSNRDTVKKIEDEFQKDSSILRNQDILIYFGMLTKQPIGLRAWGVLAIKNTPSYSKLLNQWGILDNKFMELPNISNFEFIIYLSKEIREDNNEIFKTFTIAHELQHIIQYIELKKSFKKYLLLYRYFDLINELDDQEYKNLPTEMDAFRKAKIIANRLYKKRCKLFIDEEIKIGEGIRGKNNKA